jgi:hypothetical protein
VTLRHQVQIRNLVAGNRGGGPCAALSVSITIKLSRPVDEKVLTPYQALRVTYKLYFQLVRSSTGSGKNSKGPQPAFSGDCGPLIVEALRLTRKSAGRAGDS